MADRRRRILFLTKQREAASPRYRALAWFEALRGAGWEPAMLSADDAGAGPLAALRMARRADVVVVCRRTFRGPFRRLLRLASRRLIFDFDDAIFTTPGGPSPGRARRFAAMVGQCDQVWAGNDHLAEQARPYCRDVRVLPTAIDPDRYQARPAKPHHTFDLVWVGSGSTRPYLEAIVPALERAASRVSASGNPPGVRLKIIADFSLASPRLPIAAVPWSAATEAAELASSHVGLAPLPDDPWTRGKCGLKVLQYMAAGLPVVSSDTGANRQIVRDGETGLLVSGDEAWGDAIVRLSADPALRDAMGAAGRRRVEQHYSRQAIFQTMRQALESTVAG